MVAGLIDKLGYMVVSARHITSASQLKGKRAGISSFGATSETATRFAARELGLDPDRDVSHVADRQFFSAICGAS